MVSRALEAAKELKASGIDTAVINMHTIKPIDEEMIIKCAKETKRLISIEDHNIIGGLGSAIAEVLTSKCPTKLERIGIKDHFGRSASAKELLHYYGLDAEGIVSLF